LKIRRQKALMTRRQRPLKTRKRRTLKTRRSPRKESKLRKRDWKQLSPILKNNPSRISGLKKTNALASDFINTAWRSSSRTRTNIFGT